MKQTTIARSVEGIGIGLHKGEPIKIILEPLQNDMGIVFFRSDLATGFKAEPKNVLNTQMATVIGNEKGYVSTIEHLLSAINSYGIDNIRIILDANEIPIMDGSAISFCMMLDEAGICELESDKKVIVIKREVEVRDGEKYVRVSPSKNPKFHYTIKFENPVIGKQSYTLEFSKQNFINEVARARTFGFLKDVQKLNAMGLALGGSLDNAIVIDDTHILNPEGLRFENEFVRHKILDAIGDISLLGAPMVGDYEAFAGSHELNHKLTIAILSDEKNYEIVSLDNQKTIEYAKALA